MVLFAAPHSFPKIVTPTDCDMIPVYINKVVSIDRICLRFVQYMDDYCAFVREMTQYYNNHPNPISIDCIQDENVIKNGLFILNRENLYFRVKVKEIWPDKMYFVELLDEGFDYLASGEELILNDKSDLMSKPCQGVCYSLDLGAYFDRKMEYLINYGLQKLIVKFGENYFIKISDNGVKLFYKNKADFKFVSVNDFLIHFIRSTNRASDIEKTFESKVEDEILRHKTSKDSNFAEVCKNIAGLKDLKPFCLPENIPKFEARSVQLRMKCKHVFNPSEFYLKLKKNEEFKIFIKNLNEFYEEKIPQNAVSIFVEHLYITNFKNQWIRLLILGECEFSHKSDTKFYSCLLFDKGMVGTISQDDIFELDDRFKSFPPRSVRSSLAFLTPVNEKNEMWTKEANDFFKSQVNGLTLDVFMIAFEEDDDIFYVSLAKGNENVSDLLIQKGFAQVKF